MKVPKKNLVASMACVSSFVFTVGVSPLASAVEVLSDGELQQSYLSIVTASKVEEPVKKAENKCQANADKNANVQQDLVRNKKHQSACGEGGGGDEEEDEEKEELSAKDKEKSKDKKKTSKQKNKDDKSSDNDGESAGKENKDTDDSSDSGSNASVKAKAKATSKGKDSSKKGAGSVSVGDLQSSSDDEGLATLGVKRANNSGAGNNVAGVNAGNGFVAGNDLNKQATNSALNKAQNDILGTGNNDGQSIEQIQKQLNDLQSAKINTDGTGTTVTISKPGTINFDYLYRSINGGGINKGTDIEIPSIRAGYTELKIRTHK